MPFSLRLLLLSLSIIWTSGKTKRYNLFDLVPAILLAYLIPAGISALINVNYSGSEIHSYSKQYIIPLAIVAVMSSLCISQLKSIGWKPILVFVIGSFWVAVFPAMLAFHF